MPTYDRDGHLYGGDGIFNCEYFHIGNEAAEKTYINIENEEIEIHNLVEPTEDNDAATKKYVDDNAGGGGGGGSVVIEWNEYEMTAQELVSAISDVVEAGNSFVIFDTGTSLWFHPSVCGIDGEDVNIQCYAIAYEYRGEAITSASVVGLSMNGSESVELAVQRSGCGLNILSE